MAKIDPYLQQIKNASYGEEVRGAIHDGIKQCYIDATDVVKVSETQPTDENVKLWVKPESDEYIVPTFEDFQEFEDAVTTAVDGASASVHEIGEEVDELKNVANKAVTTSKNIFDVYNAGYSARTYISGRTIGSKIGYATSSNAKTYKKCVYIEANVSYTLSYSGGTAATNRNLVLCDDDEIVLATEKYVESDNAATFKFDKSGWLYFDITADVPGIEIMIEQGTSATDFEPFDGNVYGIKLNKASVRVPTYDEFEQKTSALMVTKNLYNEQNSTIINGRYIGTTAVGEALQFATSSNRYVSITDICLKSGTTYTLSFDKESQGGGSHVAIVDDSNVLLSSIKNFNASTGAFTFLADADGYLAFDTMNITKDIMVVKGTDTEYVPSDPNVYGIYTDGVLKAVAPLKSFADLQNRIIGVGQNTYIGEKISLSKIDQTVNKCDRSLWKDFNSTDTPGLSQYRLDQHQSLAIYNGHVFLFNNAGTGAVVDYNTKEILSSFTCGETTKNHQNSAQFTNYFYDPSDEFPLLLQSQMQYNQSGSNNDKCFVYRIIRDGNNFTFTLINTISYNHETYGVSWCCDNATGTLYGVCLYNGSYDVANNNPIHILSFDMPSLAGISSGTPITLNELDIKTHAVIDHAVIQGAFYYNGMLFLSMQHYPYVTNGSCIWVIDPRQGRIKSEITLVNSWEPEGVAIYNERIYVTQRRGNDSENVNPLRIYEITL